MPLIDCRICGSSRLNYSVNGLFKEYAHVYCMDCKAIPKGLKKHRIQDNAYVSDMNAIWNEGNHKGAHND